MYVAAPDRAGEERAREIVAAAGIGTLFSATGGLDATTLPLLWEGGTAIGHLARANRHWHDLEGADVLIVVTGPEAYVSPSWYPSKTEHGRAVPTWNYSEVHLRGRARILEDPESVRDIVERLTSRHEAGREAPWSIDDAPATFIAQQLKAIVGVEVTVHESIAKQKWSRGRSAADAEGVQASLDLTAEAAAREMRRARTDT